MTSTPLLSYSTSTPSLSLEEITRTEKPKKRVGPLGTAIVAAQIALQSIFGVAPAQAQEYQADAVELQAVIAPSTSPNQYVMFLPNAPGQHGAEWKGELVLVGKETSDGIVRFTRVGATQNENDPSIGYYVTPKQTSVITPAFLGTGSWTATIIPTNGTVTATSRFWNEQNKDAHPDTNTQLFGYVQAFKAADAMLPGDTATFTLPDAGFRWNLGVLSTTGARFLVEGYDKTGQRLCSSEHTTPAGGATQLVEYLPTTCSPSYPMSIYARGTARVTVLEGDFFTQASSIQNNADLPGVQDAGIEVPKTERLVTGTYTINPATVEAGDTIIYRVNAKARDGATILGGSAQGAALQGHIDGNGTDTLDWTYAATPTVPGTYSNNSATLTVRTNIGDINRTLPGENLEVKAEQDGYVATFANAKTWILNNLDRAALAASHGYFDGKQYSQTTWKAAWPLYFDGIASASNPEATSIIFDDVGGPITGNKATIPLTSGNIQYIIGIPEPEFDEMRRGSKAVRPE